MCWNSKPFRTPKGPAPRNSLMAWFTKGPRPPSRIRSTCNFRKGCPFLKCQGCWWERLPFSVNLHWKNLFLCQKIRGSRQAIHIAIHDNFLQPVAEFDRVGSFIIPTLIEMEWGSRVFQAQLLVEKSPRVGPTGPILHYTIQSVHA